MAAIEHNPTHIQTETPSDPRELAQLEGPFRKGGRKINGRPQRNGLGAFSKLLAGLISTKTSLRTETAGIPRRGPGAAGTGGAGEVQDLLGGERARGRVKKPRPGEAGNPVPPGSPKKGPDRKDRKDRAAWTALEGEAPLLFPGARDRTAGDAPAKGAETPFPLNDGDERAPAALGTGRRGGLSRGGQTPKGVFPFQNQDTPELPVQGDIRNAALKDSPARKGEKPAPDSREARKNERRRERFSLDVQDLRTRAGPEPSPADRGLKVVEEVRPNGEIVLELRSSGEDGQSGAPGEKALSGGGSFEQLLARELRGDLSADIVKQAAIVLRDGGEGTIRLSLKPESLGKVKIHLEMAENKIAGRILVESEEALRAFEKEIHTLEQAFKDSGFEGASLNMALDYRNGGRGEDRRNAREGGPFFSGRFAALTYDAETADSRDAGAYGAGFGFQAVNVLA